jgi:catechol-2,3-dioxygenase
MVAPSKFAHVVLNTHRYEEMIDWYTRVFEARVQHRDNRLAFLTYDDEHTALPSSTWAYPRIATANSRRLQLALITSPTPGAILRS